MTTDRRSIAGRLRTVALVSLDVLLYAAVVTVVTTMLAAVVSVALGGDLVLVKTLLFLSGWVIVSYATFRLWPRSPTDSETSTRSPGEGRFQRFVRSLPPLRWLEPSRWRRERVSQPAKLFVGGLLVLLVSFLMETAGGVA
ncbi:DUF7555 family protein [Halapricum desulfuricans]|uniref:Putative membrane protein n=1 Tax=Halapricum desulfuricans TaxID=2841257 RepID=A0A897MYM7_9EURY|nr:hypothetical protein [Halapricum desulfuricans]QSG05567.1 putative membrane protein [Halapricum desulfuricans]